MEGYKKYNMLRIILIINPIPITILFIWIAASVVTQIKLFRKTITVSLRLKSIAIGFLYLVLLGTSWGITNALTANNILKYILIKCLDILLGLAYIHFLEKQKVFSA